MTAYETVQNFIRIAKEEESPHTPWTEHARQRWIGYVAALRQLGLLTTDEFFRLLREELHTTGGPHDLEQEYALYLQDTPLHDAEDLIDLRRKVAEAA